MKVITKYPIVLSGSDAETTADYNRTYAAFSGVEVITKYPIVKSTSDAETLSDYRSTYSGFLGLGSGSVRRARRASRRRKGQGFGQKLKAGAQNLLKNPFVQNVLGQKLGLSSETPSSPTSYEPSSDEKKKGLSTGAKIGIGVGVVAVIGVAAYFLTRKK